MMTFLSHDVVDMGILPNAEEDSLAISMETAHAYFWAQQPTGLHMVQAPFGFTG